LGFSIEGGRPRLTCDGATFALAPEPLATALAEGRLIPGLALDYLVLASHGLTAHGGVFMIDYLPAILAPAARILETPLAGHGEGDPPEPLLGAGLIPLGLEEPAAPGGFAAAGALELVSTGALSAERLERLAALRLEEIRPFTDSEWYQEETPPGAREPGWEASIGRPALVL
jgi:hypothetical protein